MNISDLAFPVIAVAEDATAYVQRTSERLATCSPAAVGKGYFRGLRIFDASGRQCIVKSARKVSTKRPWWSPPIFLTLITVDLEIEDRGVITPEELKEVLKSTFRRNPHSWEAGGLSYGQLVAKVDKCQSFAEIAHFINGV